MSATDAFLKPSRMEEEYNMKIKYNFKVHVLLCLKGINRSRYEILHKIFRLKGYRCHKVIKFGTEWSHLHVKFSEEEEAKEAVDLFTKNSDMTAMLVDDMLRAWYIYEMKSSYSQRGTLAIVDVLGTTPRSLNFLTKYLLNYLFEDFGQPYLLPYTAALAETHVQVLFSSMTTALAACMAFGEWYEMTQKTDRFVYRVRINPSDKETFLIKCSGGTSEEAFKLDYFLNARSEIKQKSAIKRKYDQQSEVLHNCKSNESYSRTQRCHKTSKVAHEMSQRNNGIPQMNLPIVFVPLMTPRSNSCTQILTAEQTVNADLTDNFLEVQGARGDPVLNGALTETGDPGLMNSSSHQIHEGVNHQSVTDRTAHNPEKDEARNFTRVYKCNSTRAGSVQKPSRLKHKSKKASE